MLLSDPITSLPGVGESSANKLQKLGLNTLYDLINHFPYRFQDFQAVSTISLLTADQPASFFAAVHSFASLRTKRGLTMQKAVLTDDTGKIEATWFNQPHLRSTLRPGLSFYFAGTPNFFRNHLSITSPQIEPQKDYQLHTQGLVPVYPQTEGLSSKWLRQKIFQTLKILNPGEILDPKLIAKLNLYDLPTAYQQIHFPETKKSFRLAQRRFAYNDLLAIYLKVGFTKKNWQTRQALPLKLDLKLQQRFLASLPFTLTADQISATHTIFSDISRPIPMNRLLQGDVGSGKTIVAVAAALQVINNGGQVLFLAPTQVLAHQHHLTLTAFLKPFAITPILLTAATKKAFDPSVNHNLIVGTHALLHSDYLKKSPPQLMIIDEQHRFGVLQRAHFIDTHHFPHTLTMSATPIPRTIALSYYGHLDITNLSSIPGRIPIKTWVIPLKKQADAHTWIAKEIHDQHSQVFIVYPFIDPSSADSLKNIKAATTEFIRLKTVFPTLKLKLLHGKIKPEEKNQLLDDFKHQRFDILVTTPVIEVGVDIQGATIMLIEEAQRFGLAALHQLRGRVGRNDVQSYCLIFPGLDAQSLSRLKLLEKYSDGLTLARFDLKMRGAGEMFGVSQSGHLDTNISAFWNKQLNNQAKDTAEKLISTSEDIQSLIVSLNPDLANHLAAN